jgi:hypothetical protein
MADSLAGLEERLAGMEQTMRDLAPILTEVGNEITSELRSDAPRGNGEGAGALQSSISLSVQPTQFAISMNDYGVFQNYGVVGYKGGDRATNPRGGQDIPDENFPQGSGDGGRYQFGVKQPSKGWGAYYTGFNKNIGWFDIDEITERVKTRIQTKIIQAF